MSIIRYTGLILFLLSFVSFFCCKNKTTDCEGYDYSGCQTTRPVKGTLVIKLTINEQNPAVHVKIFRGKFEQNDLIREDTLTDELWRPVLPVDEYYTVAAYYKAGGKTIIAIDGDKIKLKSAVKCDSTCYSVKDGKVDVKLKYE
jgi:hypothetical protein